MKLEMICAEPGTMPTRKPSTVPRAIGIADSRHSLRVGSSSRSRGAADLAGHAVARRREDFAEPEQADRDRHDADAVAELGNVEGIAEMAGHHVDADTAEQQPEAAISRVRASDVDDM